MFPNDLCSGKLTVKTSFPQCGITQIWNLLYLGGAEHPDRVPRRDRVFTWPASLPWNPRSTCSRSLKEDTVSCQDFGFKTGCKWIYLPNESEIKPVASLLLWPLLISRLRSQECAKPASSNHHRNNRMSLMEPHVFHVHLDTCHNRNRLTISESRLMWFVALKPRNMIYLRYIRLYYY